MKKIMILLAALTLAAGLTGCVSKAERAYGKAQEKIRSGKYEDAIAELDKVIDSSDKSDPEETEMFITSLYLKGDCYLQLGKAEKATEAYDKALEEDIKPRDFQLEDKVFKLTRAQRTEEFFTKTERRRSILRQSTFS